MARSANCSSCGGKLGAGSRDGVCGRCLAEAAVTVQHSASGVSASGPIPGDTLRYFGDYELLSEVARGGMGVVYRARQVSLNQSVALKMVLAAEFASPEQVKRFHLEAEAAANLDHPNIVPIYEIGEHEGHHYYSMKLVEGDSLSRHAASFSRDLRRAAEIMMKVARAVHYAHQRGLLHRDIKPGNILLDAKGEPLVTDFGLAKRIESESDLTHPGSLLGTPNYMAPEQAAGGSRQVTTRSDVFSLGAVLYHLVTGRPPFEAPTVLETLRKVIDEEPAPPASINPGIDPDLATICAKCLEKESSRRFDSAEALADELDRWLRREPILSRPISMPEKAMKWIRRQPVVAGLAGAAIAAALFGAIGIVCGAVRRTKECSRSSAPTPSEKRFRSQQRRAHSFDPWNHLRSELIERAASNADCAGDRGTILSSAWIRLRSWISVCSAELACRTRSAPSRSAC